MDISTYMASGTDAVQDLAGSLLTNGLEIVTVVIGVGAVFYLIRLGWYKLRGTVR